MEEFNEAIYELSIAIDREELKGLDMNEVIEFKIDGWLQDEFLAHFYPELLDHVLVYYDWSFLNAVNMLKEVCHYYSFYIHGNNLYAVPKENALKR